MLKLGDRTTFNSAISGKNVIKIEQKLLCNNVFLTSCSYICYYIMILFKQFYWLSTKRKI